MSEIRANEAREERKLRERAEWIQGLRDLADFFESKPELPKPYRLYINEWVSSNDGTDVVKAQMASIAKALSPCKKDYSSDSFSIEKNIGPHYLSYSTTRETVCVRKVVGTKMVETEPSRYYPEVPAHEEDIVEWECSPLLAATEEQPQD